MLIVSTSRSILTAAIGKEAGAYLDALRARRMLPDHETPLNLRAELPSFSNHQLPRIAVDQRVFMNDGRCWMKRQYNISHFSKAEICVLMILIRLNTDLAAISPIRLFVWAK